jgi:hypothetical protein
VGVAAGFGLAIAAGVDKAGGFCEKAQADNKRAQVTNNKKMMTCDLMAEPPANITHHITSTIVRVILSHAPAGQVETRNDKAFVAPALLPVLVSSKGMPKHGQECPCHTLLEAAASRLTTVCHWERQMPIKGQSLKRTP